MIMDTSEHPECLVFCGRVTLRADLEGLLRSGHGGAEG